jgi:hypothetical protein
MNRFKSAVFCCTYFISNRVPDDSRGYDPELRQRLFHLPKEKLWIGETRHIASQVHSAMSNKDLEMYDLVSNFM